MTNFFARQAIRYKNQMQQSFGELVGLAEGLIADQDLNDHEIKFLNDWLQHHEAIRHEWPGDVIYARLQATLADNIITPDERAHLIQTLRQLIGGRLDQLAAAPKINTLALDDVDALQFPNLTFCLTGDFVYAPRDVCADHIVRRGGQVSNSITKKLNYLVVGGLGSEEWKHGSFGTKIAKAMQYKQQGVPLLIVHEDVWASSL